MPLKQMGLKPPETALPLWACGPLLIHQCCDRLHSPPQTTARLIHTLPHNYASRPHWLQWDGPSSPPKLPFPFDDNHPIKYIHPSTDPTHQPTRHPDPLSRFATIHFRTDRPTNRPTDGPGEKPVPLVIMLESERHTNNKESIYKALVQMAEQVVHNT